MCLPVCSNRASTKGPNFFGGIIPTSSCLALRQNGSFLSLKMRSRMCRLLPR